MKKITFLVTLVVLVASGCGAPTYESVTTVQISAVDESVEASFYADQLSTLETLIKTNSAPKSVSVSASYIKLSHLIEIKASGPDPGDAADAVNAVARAYVSEQNDKVSLTIVSEAMVPVRPINRPTWD